MKHINGKGEADYDFRNDVLFFKTAERNYKTSLEIENITIDIDNGGFIVGIQIFEASKFLGISKKNLLEIARWKYQATINEGRIEISLVFSMMIRNKLVEMRPIIMQPVPRNLPNTAISVT